MAREFSRSERVADYIKRELALLLQRELRDPRVKNPNVNAVVISRDMAYAKVYVTFMGVEDSEAAQAVEVLNGAAGFLRSQLASEMRMRSTPNLRFYFDESVRTGQYLSDLIDRAVAGDQVKESAKRNDV